MSERVVASQKFDAGPLHKVLNEIYTETAGAIRKPLEQNVPGAQTFRDANEVRLVIQYEIKTDTFTGCFHTLIEIPDAD